MFTVLSFVFAVATNTVVASDTDPSPYFIPSTIELLAFEGRGIDDGVVLYWETSAEWQSDAYIVERSSDGRDWEAIGQLEAAGNHVGPRRYLYVDQTPFAGNNFYRLVERDYLGEGKVSDMIDIVYDGAYDPAVFPNPVRPSQDINVRMFGFENQEMQVELISVDGRRIGRRSFDMTEGENRVSWPAPNVRAGLYFVRVFIDDYPVTTYRLMIAEG